MKRSWMVPLFCCAWQVASHPDSIRLPASQTASNTAIAMAPANTTDLFESPYYDEEDVAADDTNEPSEDEPKDEMEAELWGELDIDDNRDEPILKTVVVVIGFLMVYGLWRTHCQQCAQRSWVCKVFQNPLHSFARGWHQPVPISAADADAEEWRGRRPDSMEDSHPLSCDRQAPHNLASLSAYNDSHGGNTGLVFDHGVRDGGVQSLDAHRPPTRTTPAKLSFAARLDIFSLAADRLAL